MKRKKQTIIDYPKPSAELVRIAPSYTTIKDLNRYAGLNTDTIQKLIDKGFGAYVNKTIFKQQQRMVELRYVSSNCDCSQNYVVDGIKGMTVKQGMDWILQQNKYNGIVSLVAEEFDDGMGNDGRFLYAYENNKTIPFAKRYDKSRILPNSSEYLDRVIDSASACAGWNNDYDFLFFIKPKVQNGYEITNQYEFSF